MLNLNALDALQAVLTTAGVQGYLHFVPTLWTDLSAVGLNKNERVVAALLTAMCHYQPSDAADSSDGSVALAEQMKRIVAHLVQLIKDRAEEQKTHRIQVSGPSSWGDFKSLGI